MYRGWTKELHNCSKQSVCSKRINENIRVSHLKVWASTSIGKADGKKKTKKGERSQRDMGNKEGMFKALEGKLSLPKEEISQNYDQFMKTCPNGEMTKAQFLAAQGGSLAESLFRVFDEDGSGSMDFTEYMLASNCTSLTQPQEKLSWIFNVFDEDGGGSIDIDEVIKLVIGLTNMGGVEAEREVLLACVQDILEAIDVDRDGDITREEFANNAMKSSFIRKMLGGI